MEKELIQRLIAAYRQVPIGNPLDTGTLMGPLISVTAVEAMQNAFAPTPRGRRKNSLRRPAVEQRKISPADVTSSLAWPRRSTISKWSMKKRSRPFFIDAV